jgi:hypothetical protein
MIISFVTNNVKEIINIVHVQKCWSLKRFCHLVNVKVNSKNLKHINHFNFNKVIVKCKNTLESHEFSQLSNVVDVTIDARYSIKANLIVLKRCKILKLINCRKTKLPQNIKELELEYSSYNVVESDCEELNKITISDQNYDQDTFEQLYRFRNLKEIWLMNCPFIYELGVCEKLDALILASDYRREYDMHLYTSSKDLFLTRLDVDLEVVDLGLFDHLPILTSLSIYNLTSDQNNLDWIVKLKLLKNLHFYYFDCFPKLPMLPNVVITYVEKM